MALKNCNQFTDLMREDIRSIDLPMKPPRLSSSKRETPSWCSLKQCSRLFECGLAPQALLYATINCFESQESRCYQHDTPKKSHNEIIDPLSDSSKQSRFYELRMLDKSAVSQDRSIPSYPERGLHKNQINTRNVNCHRCNPRCVLISTKQISRLWEEKDKHEHTRCIQSRREFTQAQATIIEVSDISRTCDCKMPWRAI